MTTGQTIPILRIFDEEKAKEFYVSFLGFQVDWEHRFEEGLPLYLQVSRNGCVLHLSEHHGDACPGGAVRIEMKGVADYCRKLRESDYRYCRPGEPERQSWGTTEITLQDPFGNRLVFYERD